MSAVLKGKVAVVTGASRGIGRAIAQAFAREGAAVVVCGRKPETLAQAAAEMAGGAGTVRPVTCHVGRPADIRNLVETTVREFGRIDILVNNAATNIAQEPALETDEAKFDKMIEINLKSAFRLIQAVAPGMCARGSGSIINIASIAGLRPQYQGMLYSMTKAALIMMTQSYALELGPAWRARERHRARPGGDGAERIFLEGRGAARAVPGRPAHPPPRPAGGNCGNGSAAGRRPRFLHHRADHGGGWRKAAAVKRCGTVPRRSG